MKDSSGDVGIVVIVLRAMTAVSHIGTLPQSPKLAHQMARIVWRLSLGAAPQDGYDSP
jgi:hypothetical protein